VSIFADVLATCRWSLAFYGPYCAFSRHDNLSWNACQPSSF